MPHHSKPARVVAVVPVQTAPAVQVIRRCFERELPTTCESLCFGDFGNFGIVLDVGQLVSDVRASHPFSWVIVCLGTLAVDEENIELILLTVPPESTEFPRLQPLHLLPEGPCTSKERRCVQVRLAEEAGVFHRRSALCGRVSIGYAADIRNKRFVSAPRGKFFQIVKADLPIPRWLRIVFSAGLPSSSVFI